MAKQIFYYEESPYHPGYYLIHFHHDWFNTEYTSGSFNLMAARLLDLGYADYLRMCRDVFGATLMGKGEIYPIACFKKGESLFALLKLLNSLANTVMFEVEHPDFNEHQKVVEEYKNSLNASSEKE